MTRCSSNRRLGGWLGSLWRSASGTQDQTRQFAGCLPDDLSGKTVLDVGCGAGLTCIEAARRGARQVIGLDANPECIRMARLAAAEAGVEITFHVHDIERQPLTGQFDYVLCLNLLNGLGRPIAAIDTLIGATREILVVELEGIGRSERKQLGLSRLQQAMVSRLPIILVSRSGARCKRPAQSFVISQNALRNLVFEQRGQIASLAFTRLEGRSAYRAIAEKRRIGRLLVVSGPTSAGKKTLMRKLMSNQLPAIASMTGSPDGSLWGTPVNSAREPVDVKPDADRVLLHHDFLRPVLRGTMTHERDESLDLLQVARNITFLTVWTQPSLLAGQVYNAEIAQSPKSRKSAHHRMVMDLYRTDPARIIREYERWFSFTERWPGRHIVVSPHEGYRIKTIGEWRGEAAGRP